MESLYRVSSNLWFTSDTHFAHNKIQEFCPDTRYQGSLLEHDEILIENWNSCVRKGDRIYHLGDFSFGSREYTEALCKRLKGDKHLIYGNHDEVLRTPKFAPYFSSRQEYKEIRVDNIKVCMFHFPIHEWNQCHRGSYHLFGHVHSTYKTVGGKSLNVGIDSRTNPRMMPWHWDEVRANLEHLDNKAHH